MTGRRKTFRVLWEIARELPWPEVELLDVYQTYISVVHTHKHSCCDTEQKNAPVPVNLLC
jgi:hypothetical protein